MHKLLGAVAVLLVGGSLASAQGLPYGAAPPAPMPPPVQASCGLHPWLIKILHVRPCSKLGKASQCPPAGPVGGTLVFPNHPFARAPRDYFMID